MAKCSVLKTSNSEIKLERNARNLTWSGLIDIVVGKTLCLAHSKAQVPSPALHIVI